MDFIEDLRLVDGPVLWIAWTAGTAGLLYLLWQSRRTAGAAAGSKAAAGRLVLLLPPAAAVLAAAVLLAGAHWALIYVFSVFPAELPPEVLAWSLPAVAALLLWLMRLWGVWRPPGAARAPGRNGARRPARSTAVATAALLGVVLLSAVQINGYFGLNHTVSDLTGTALARIQPLEDGLKRGPSATISLSGWTPPADLPRAASCGGP